MKFRIVWLVAIILSLIFLVPSPSVAEEKGLDPSKVTPIELTALKGYVAAEESYVSEREYKDPTLSIVIEKDRYLDTDIWIARVQIAHPSQIRTILADRYNRSGTARVDVMAKRAKAVLTINGDYYSYVQTGLVIRQGNLYRNRPSGKSDMLIIDDQGDFHTILTASDESVAAALTEFGGPAEDGGKIVNCFTFGPALVLDGKLAHEEFIRVDNAENTRAQHMVIAQVGPLSYLCVTTEGPESKNSQGLILQELAEYLLKYDCLVAYNLDGGSSSSMVFHSMKINSLDTHKVRAVSDAIYFSTGIYAPEGEE